MPTKVLSNLLINFTYTSGVTIVYYSALWYPQGFSSIVPLASDGGSLAFAGIVTLDQIQADIKAAAIALMEELGTYTVVDDL